MLYSQNSQVSSSSKKPEIASVKILRSSFLVINEIILLRFFLTFIDRKLSSSEKRKCIAMLPYMIVSIARTQKLIVHLIVTPSVRGELRESSLFRRRLGYAESHSKPFVMYRGENALLCGGSSCELLQYEKLDNSKTLELADYAIMTITEDTLLRRLH